jgi:two-component system osmolarity sensor histidine kinase EnvZ
MTLNWPRTLFGRNIALLITTVLVTQFAAVIVFMIFAQRPRIDDAAGLVAGQIIALDSLLSAVTPEDRPRFVTRLDGQTAMPAGTFNIRGRIHDVSFRGLELRMFLKRISDRVPDDIDMRGHLSPDFRLWVHINVAGERYWFALPASRSPRYNGIVVSISLSLTLGALATLAAYLIHRRINRPLKQLATAAERLGRGTWPDPVPVTGPQEISTVAATFNRMTEGLAEIEATRAAMLAGISHDIRTPLTKLRLAIAMPDTLDAPLASAERFIDDIDIIVQQFIDFARGADGEAATPGDLNALIAQLAADFAGLGHPFSQNLGAVPQLPFRPVGMLRLLMNLMQNAVDYGKVGLMVQTWSDARFAYVVVEDRGPGVTEPMLTLIKQPFRRGQEAAGQRGGSGLGLAIANRIAQQHGGTLELTRRQRGGLKATVRLPLTASV